jgi:hypothetical protein
VTRRAIPRGLAYVAGAVGALALPYAAYVARTWYHYGRASRNRDGDPLLDRFMPVYDVAERHEIRVGAVTRPWEADVQFRSVPPDEFAAFHEPRYVKIVWNLAAEALGPGRSVFHTETRVATTDAYARALPPLLGGVLARHTPHPP